MSKKETLGERVKSLRIGENLTTYQLADSVFVNQSYIVKIENNVKSPSSDVLNRLADRLKCTTDYLLGRE